MTGVQTCALPISMTEQQQHLTNLIRQREELDRAIAQNRELFWKVQGAIEYLNKIGVTLPDSADSNDEQQNVVEE